MVNLRSPCVVPCALLLGGALVACGSGGSSASAPDDGGSAEAAHPATDAATDAGPRDGAALDATNTGDGGNVLDAGKTGDAGNALDAGNAPDAHAESGADAGPLGPIDLASATIYAVYPSIFSQSGKLADVTAQLARIHALGFDVLWLMPVTPIGQPTGSHPASGSPYCVHDYMQVNPAYGSSADLVALVKAAHALGMHVILDEVLNHTAWDSALVTQHPEYYLHSDGNPQNVASIEQAFTFADVAQLDYKSQNGLAAYMTQMLSTWVTTYDLDGFRFDTADAPYGDGRMIPASFWQALRTSLEAVKPGLLMLGEEQDPALADAPFELDYGWTLQGQYGPGGLKQVATGGDASLLQQAWAAQKAGEPAAMQHMTLLQDWDMEADLTMYGGAAPTMAAATFDFTLDGVPLLFNGEEVGNDKSGNNTHTVIDWTGPNAATFTAFYTSLLALRNGASTLRRGALGWVTNSAPSKVASFTRSDASGTYLVVVSFSGSALTGTVASPAANGWTDVSPTGSPGGHAHAAPPALSLAPYDFAVFRAK
jgi:glycosidase